MDGVRRLTDLRVEHEFRTFKEMEIPDSYNAIWFIQGSRIFVVGGDTQFWILVYDEPHKSLNSGT